MILYDNNLINKFINNSFVLYLKVDTLIYNTL